MKKSICSMLLAVIVIASISGCTALVEGSEYSELDKLQADLGKKAKEYARSGFGTEINLKDFKISMGEKVAENQFEGIKSIEGLKEVYYTGNVKGEPEYVIDFVLVYDTENEKTVEFGIKTMDDYETVYMDRAK